MKIKARITGASHNYINGKLTLNLEIIEGNEVEIDNLLDKELSVELKKYRNSRSDRANRMLWACIGDLANAQGKKNWDVYLDVLKEYGQYTHLEVNREALSLLKREWREIQELSSYMIVENDGTITEKVEVLCFFGSHLYDSKEFSILLDGVIQDMKDLGLDIPPTEELQRVIDALRKDDEKHNTT